MNKYKVAFYIFLILPLICTSQTVVWSEDFSTHSNGTTNDPGGKWTSTCTGCTSSGTAFFDVRSNAFEGQDTDAEGIWLSEWINVSAYASVNLSAIVTGDADNDAGEYSIVEYSADNGAFTAFLHGSNNPLGAINRTGVALVTGADSVRIRWRMIVSATSEQNVLDNIFVVAVDNEPGSGFALDFDDAGSSTTGNVVELSNFPNIVGGDFTITAWINSDNVATSAQRIFCDDQGNTADGFAISLGDPGSGIIRFYIRSANPVSMDMSTAAYYLTSNTWYHIAAVHNATANSRTIYVNGVVAETGTYTNNPGASPDALASIGGETAASAENTNRFDGEIDEVTVWTAALTQTQIRDLMCRKTNTSASNLLAYYKFDDGRGYMARDETGTYHGSMTNMSESTEWTTSGAAIGDNSTYNYTGSWAGVSVYLESAQDDSLRVSSVTGTPSGVHVYNVQSAPNVSTGADGIGGNDTYFGVFKCFGTTPTYTATYHYLENDALQLGTLDESAMVVYKRDNNSDLTWSAVTATLNTTSKTISMTGESTEYILGNTFTPLPVTLLDFNVVPDHSFAKIIWETISEINNDYFTIERSADLSNFESVAAIPGAGNSRQQRNYSFTDIEPLPGLSYYRLRQTDYDGNYTFSGIRTFRNNDVQQLTLYPNPANDRIYLTGLKEIPSGSLTIVSSNGIVYRIIPRIVSDNTVLLDVSQLSEGIYLIRGLDDFPGGIRVSVFH